MIFFIWNQALSKLCDIRLGTTSVRPICNLVTLTDLWIPSPLSKAEGKEIEKLSLLGPFLSLSVFSEDCVSKLIILQNSK